MTKHFLELPAGCTLRAARAEDAWVIRLLVLRAMLDPTQLRWQQFWIVECDERVVACGQLRSFSGVQELGSLVVARSWQRQGLGTFLVQHLIQSATQPLYLECLGSKLTIFYSRLGFVSVKWQDLPQSLKLKFSLSALAATLFRLPVTFMRYRD